MRFEDAIKMEKVDNPSKRAIMNVYYTGYWLTDRVNEILKPFGISEQQFNVLKVLRDHKNNGSNLCDIQERMMHKMSNATRLVEKLRLKALVTRETCEENRRRVDVKLTDKGLMLMAKIEEQLEKLNGCFYNKLTKEEYTQLAELLDKLRD
jgi:DNA-binding MarR family transcriptional regulator